MICLLFLLMFMKLFISGKAMHKEEQPTIYYYRVVKDCSVTLNNKTYNYEVGKSIGLYNLVETTEDYKEKYENENFVLAFKIRPAFIGDMQKEFDEAYGFSNKERYINNLLNNPPATRYIRIEKPTYIRINIFQWVWMKFKEAVSNYKFRKWQKEYLRKDMFKKLDNDFLDLIYKKE